MKRKIEFRAKRTDHDEWIYGDLLTPTDLMDVWEISESTGMGDKYDIDPETIGQFTGLTDKNGNKIFEGDIIKTKFFGKDNRHGQNFADYDYFRVEYHEASFCIENASRRFVINTESAKRFEIIGNIYDNLELLEIK